MAGFTDLIGKAQPALVGGGCRAAATEGATWRWTFTGVEDNDGNPINLTGATGTCTIYADGLSLTTLTFTGASGGFTLSATAANTAGLAGSAAADGKPRVCSWSLTLTSGSETIVVWSAVRSPFYIFQG